MESFLVEIKPGRDGENVTVMWDMSQYDVGEIESGGYDEDLLNHYKFAPGKIHVNPHVNNRVVNVDGKWKLNQTAKYTDAAIGKIKAAAGDHYVATNEATIYGVDGDLIRDNNNQLVLDVKNLAPTSNASFGAETMAKQNAAVDAISERSDFVLNQSLVNKNRYGDDGYNPWNDNSVDHDLTDEAWDEQEAGEDWDGPMF